MFEFIDTILLRFRSCFSRKAAFHWFVIIVVGFLIRSDTLGVTSVIRDLAILPSCYPCLLHFFLADSWKDEVLLSTWIKTVVELAPLKKNFRSCCFDRRWGKTCFRWKISALHQKNGTRIRKCKQITLPLWTFFWCGGSVDRVRNEIFLPSPFHSSS